MFTILEYFDSLHGASMRPARTRILAVRPACGAAPDFSRKRHQNVAERLIEVGKLRIHLQEDDDAVSLLQSLMRHVSNQEIATMLAVSERTVRRWMRAGHLPQRQHARLKLSDLIEYLSREPEPTPRSKRRLRLRGHEPRPLLADLMGRLSQEAEGAPKAKRRPA